MAERRFEGKGGTQKFINYRSWHLVLFRNELIFLL